MLQTCKTLLCCQKRHFLEVVKFAHDNLYYVLSRYAEIKIMQLFTKTNKSYPDTQIFKKKIFFLGGGLKTFADKLKNFYFYLCYHISCHSMWMIQSLEKQISSKTDKKSFFIIKTKK